MVSDRPGAEQTQNDVLSRHFRGEILIKCKEKAGRGGAGRGGVFRSLPKQILLTREKNAWKRVASERPGAGQSENDVFSHRFRKEVLINRDKQCEKTCGFGQAGRGAK